MNVSSETHPPFTKDPVQLSSPFAGGLPRDAHAAEDPARYVIEDDGLVAAVNAALILGQPLLLGGDPGTGKSTLAARLAWQLKLGKPLKFVTKSTSVARDLFYQYDAVSRFQAAHQEGADPIGNLAFIDFHALGEAIILTGTGHEDLLQRVRITHAKRTGTESESLATPRRSVVLIDEIDKAHRDFPNDLLNEIEGMSFSLPELGGRQVVADSAYRPIVVITTNSEKNLPAPFLRRCVYYHIEYPKEPGLEKILRARLDLPHAGNLEKKALTGSVLSSGLHDLVRSSIQFFQEMRTEKYSLSRKPATAELIGWTRLLIERGANPLEPLAKLDRTLIEWTVSALAKTKEDFLEVRNRLADLIAASNTPFPA